MNSTNGTHISNVTYYSSVNQPSSLLHQYSLINQPSNLLQFSKSVTHQAYYSSVNQSSNLLQLSINYQSVTRQTSHKIKLYHVDELKKACTKPWHRGHQLTLCRRAWSDQSGHCFPAAAASCYARNCTLHSTVNHMPLFQQSHGNQFKYDQMSVKFQFCQECTAQSTISHCINRIMEINSNLIKCQ